MTDTVIDTASKQIRRASAGEAPQPQVTAFFHEPTFTATYVVADPATKRAAIIDSVLDFDETAGRTSTEAADAIVAFVQDKGLTVDWLLETHVHADHLSAAPYLQERLGGKTSDRPRNHRPCRTCSARCSTKAANSGATDRSSTGCSVTATAFRSATLTAVALHVPGHTPADMAYVIGDAAFHRRHHVHARLRHRPLPISLAATRTSFTARSGA